MLSAHADRYIALRRTLGYTLRDLAAQLRHFTRFAEERGDTHIRTETALAWASQGPSPRARQVRLRGVILLARFLRAEDPRHEVPQQVFNVAYARPLPYIYTPEEIRQLLDAALRLRKSYPLRRAIYTTLLGLIAATGLRVSEALDLRLEDVLADGVLRVRDTKFGKSRLVPLHPTVTVRLEAYLALRVQRPVEDDHVFLSPHDRRISAGTVSYTFRRILKLSGVGAGRPRAPRIHDLRHTFATRALEGCPHTRGEVGRHFVGLATYLGHADIGATYWYLEATPQLLTDIAAAARALVIEEGA
jgi:integrase/recombinase XerD